MFAFEANEHKWAEKWNYSFHKSNKLQDNSAKKAYKWNIRYEAIMWLYKTNEHIESPTVLYNIYS